MLPIPEILKGEVKELSEILRVWCPDHNTHPEYMIIETEIYDFYNQPLTPENIGEAMGAYFNIQTKITGYGYDARCGDTDLKMDKNILIIDTPERRYTFPFPKTLNQLITYCSELKLQWRQ